MKAKNWKRIVKMGKLRFRRKKAPLQLLPPPSQPVAAKKKPGGSRLWMRMDRWGQSELIDCDKSVIIKRASIPARDLRILGPIFSNSSRILAREKAMIVDLEFIGAIIRADEFLLLDPLHQEVLPFVDQLRAEATITSKGHLKGDDRPKHLLNDNENMAQLYLTRKWLENQHQAALFPPQHTSIGAAAPPVVSSAAITMASTWRTYLVQLDGSTTRLQLTRTIALQTLTALALCTM